MHTLFFFGFSLISCQTLISNTNRYLRNAYDILDSVKNMRSVEDMTARGRKRQKMSKFPCSVNVFLDNNADYDVFFIEL